MILELVNIDRQKIKVKAHRVLSHKYPKLELYLHYSLNEAGNATDNTYFNVSNSDGISLARFPDESAWSAVETARYYIDKIGEDKLLKYIEEYRNNPLSDRWIPKSKRKTVTSK